MKQKLIRSLHSSNLKQQESHCSIDSVHTLGIAAIKHPIGVASIHAIDALQPEAYNDLVDLLTRKSYQTIRCNQIMLRELSKLVIYEAVMNKCLECTGIAQQMIENKIINCQGCNGSGLNRHSDHNRAKSLNVTLEVYTKYWASRLLKVQSIYSAECRNAMVVAREIN